MIKIDVDPEVFGFLQEHARAFVDTPNDVLRHLLLTREAKLKRRFASVPDFEQPSILGSSLVEDVRSRVFDFPLRFRVREAIALSFDVRVVRFLSLFSELQ